MSLYAYCLSDEVTAGAVESIKGVANERPRLIRRGGLAAVVSAFKDERAAVTRENVLAHERVVRRVLVETTPLPFRFGTVVTEERLLGYVDSQHDALQAQLGRVRGCVEMSVKVIWKVEAVRDEAWQRDEEERAAGGGPWPSGVGTAFLATKRREILGDETSKERAAEVAEWLNESLKGTVREAQASIQPTKSLVVAVAYLVERARLEEYRAALHSAQRERQELHFLTSGAWPPYSFVALGS